jgi:peptide/nickel transport system substrate-binding protein
LEEEWRYLTKGDKKMAGSYWEKFTNQRISRRRALQAASAASAGAGAIWLVGCGGGDDDDGTPSGTETPTNGATEPPDEEGPSFLNEKNPPVPGGRYQTYGTANFDTFDPHLGIAGSTAYFARVYNVLVNQSATRPKYIVYDLATQFENPDDTTWTFTLRPGVKIGPNPLGVPERDMDAQDVVATFDRIKNEPRANNGAFVKEFVESVTASADGKTVTIKTTKPYAWFLNRVGNFVNCIPPRELIADASSIEKMRSTSAGGGPYRIVSSTEGEGAKLDKNPAYYKKDEFNNDSALPYLDGIDVRLIADRAAQRTAFQSGQIYQYTPETKSEADSLAGSNTIAKDPAFTFIALTMHPEKEPFTDIRARQAFSYAINRQQVIDIVYQGDAKPNGLVHWPVGEGTFAFTKDELEQYQPYDPAKARELVSALGGLKVKMMYPAASAIEQHDKVLPLFLEWMKDANIEIEQDPQDFTTWLENYRTLNYTLSLSLNQVYETPETPLNFHVGKGPIGDRSYAIGLNDPAIEAAIEKTKTTLDLEENIKAVRDAQILIYEKGPTFLPFVSWFSYTAFAKKVHNIPSGVGTTALLLNTSWVEA